METYYTRRNKMIGKDVYICAGPDKGEFGVVVGVSGYGNLYIDLIDGGSTTASLDEVRVRQPIST